MDGGEVIVNIVQGASEVPFNNKEELLSNLINIEDIVKFLPEIVNIQKFYFSILNKPFWIKSLLSEDKIKNKSKKLENWEKFPKKTLIRILHLKEEVDQKEISNLKENKINYLNEILWLEKCKVENYKEKKLISKDIAIFLSKKKWSWKKIEIPLEISLLIIKWTIAGQSNKELAVLQHHAWNFTRYPSVMDDEDLLFKISLLFEKKTSEIVSKEEEISRLKDRYERLSNWPWMRLQQRQENDQIQSTNQVRRNNSSFYVSFLILSNSILISTFFYFIVYPILNYFKKRKIQKNPLLKSSSNDYFYFNLFLIIFIIPAVLIPVFIS